MKDRKVKYIVYSIVVTLILAIGFSFAFFTARIVNNNKQVTIKAGQLNIIFTDTTEINTNNVRPDWTTSKTFTVENQSSKVFHYNIYIKDLINTLVTEDYLQYRITSTDGYNMTEFMPIAKSASASKFYLANNIAIDGGVTQTYTIEFRYKNDPDVDQSDDMGKTFSGQMMIEEATINPNSLYSKLTKNYTVETRTDFSTVFGGTTIQDGYNSTGTIYKAGNDYYFAGNPSDNWVKFADKWWRIIRTNSTEGTRLLYAGSSAEGQDGYINDTKYKWNSSYDSYTYVYWSNSSFKSILNSWYSSNITGNDDNMVNSIVYCNDTSYTDMSSSWGENGRKFGAYSRLYDSKNPSYACGTNNFGVASKVGMMTADEVAFTGVVYNGQSAPNTYYYRNSKIDGCTGQSNDPCSVTGDNRWWTLTPNQFVGGVSANVFNVYGAGNVPGGITYAYVAATYAVRPVVTLKLDVIVTGDGTTENPYVPSL